MPALEPSTPYFQSHPPAVAEPTSPATSMAHPLLTSACARAAAGLTRAFSFLGGAIADRPWLTIIASECESVQGIWRGCGRTAMHHKSGCHSMAGGTGALVHPCMTAFIITN